VDCSNGIAGFWFVDRLGVLVVMKGQVLPQFGRMDQKKTGLSEELRANLCSFGLIPKPNATLR
jgi:hypothetical protein